MELDYEQLYHQVEDKHWWFTSRQNLIAQYVSKNWGYKKLDILEIGNSSGILTQILENKGHNVIGIDISPRAIENAKERGINSILMDGSKPNFPGLKFDLIIASDVLEHLKDDISSVRNWKDLLKEDGYILAFVPAHRFLWSKFDDLNCHYKRYSLKEFKSVFTQNGLMVKQFTYWNFLMFFPVFLLRSFFKLLGENKKTTLVQIRTPIWIFNEILKGLIFLENKLILEKFRLPIGISCMVTSKKPKEP
jgi:SAM-dependent methyltransferase